MKELVSFMPIMSFFQRLKERLFKLSKLRNEFILFNIFSYIIIIFVTSYKVTKYRRESY
jgi:hypothetical protein